MDRSFNQWIAQLGDFVRGLTLKQKASFLAGAIVVTAMLFLFVKMIKSPDYKPLYSGMKPEEARAVATRLSAKSIQYELSTDGTAINVPSDQVDAARVLIVSEGVPHTGRMGFELFDTSNWGGSDFSEKVNYQRALEGELERTIQTLSEVESARVHLVMPVESTFLQDQHEAKAAVTIKLKGERYSEETARAISRLVASAVDRLRPENVTVVDAETNRPLDGFATGVSERTAELEQQLADKLVKTLEPVVGPDGARASVRVEYELGTSEEDQETYDPNSSIALTMQKSEEHSGGLTLSGVPGTANNVPGSVSTQGVVGRAEDNAQSISRAENGTYAVNKVVRRTMLPPGRVKRLAVALLVDDSEGLGSQSTPQSRRKRTPEEMKQIEELAKAALGIDPSRGDILSVQNLSFRQKPAEIFGTPGKLWRAKRIVDDYAGVLRYAAISLLFLLTYALVLRPVKKQAVAAFRQLARDATGTKPRLGRTDDTATIDVVADSISLGEGTTQSKRAVAIKKHLLEKVKAEPIAASRLVQSWMREGRTE